MHSSLAPWLTVADGHRALSFYQSAFGAQEVYRHEGPDGSLIVRLAVGEAEFWVSGGAVGEAAGSSAAGAAPLGGESVRMILTVADPDAMFARALAAGATEIFPVGEGHGWRLGRLADPFGLHWEIGHPL
ncbi:MAG TPA: VOC family protein [Puia sp.]|jgi:PhnB protein